MATVSSLAFFDLITETWVDEVRVALNQFDAWTSYTPSDSNITVGNGTRTAAYSKVGKTVAVRYSLVAGTTSALHASNVAQVGLPFAAKAGVMQVLPAYYFDNAVRHWVGVAVINGTASASHAMLVQTESTGSGTVLTGAPSAAWFGNADRLVVSGYYEAA